jgi:hypothetical protein
MERTGAGAANGRRCLAEALSVQDMLASSPPLPSLAGRVRALLVRLAATISTIAGPRPVGSPAAPGGVR